MGYTSKYMDNFSFFTRMYYAYLGRALAAAFYSQYRQFLWMSIRSWIQWGAFGLFVAALGLRWGQTAVLLTLLLFLWIQFSYWRAGRMGYNKFVVDKTAVMPEGDLTMIPPGEKIAIHASGTFAVSHRDNTVFMRPAEYWYAPLGDHIVMVHENSSNYLYQFFSPVTLQQIQKGWILFGKSPLNSLALTIDDVWIDDSAGASLRYYVGAGDGSTKRKQKSRTIYFTFEDEPSLVRVWESIVACMRQARQVAS